MTIFDTSKGCRFDCARSVNIPISDVLGLAFASEAKPLSYESSSRASETSQNDEPNSMSVGSVSLWAGVQGPADDVFAQIPYFRPQEDSRPFLQTSRNPEDTGQMTHNLQARFNLSPRTPNSTLSPVEMVQDPG